MKIRSGFVSNSSTSSFIIAHKTPFDEFLKRDGIVCVDNCLSAVGSDEIFKKSWFSYGPLPELKLKILNREKSGYKVQWIEICDKAPDLTLLFYDLVKSGEIEILLDTDW